MLSKIIATIFLRSMSPMTQSAPIDEPALEGESHADRDLRLWPKHMHVRGGYVAIPAMAMQKCIAKAAQYSGKKIVGEGKKTWTAKFEAGIAIFDDILTNVPADTVKPIALYMNLDGKRGGSVRGIRNYPRIPEWSATFDIQILDPIITKPILEEMLELAGLFVGVGQFRPEKGGNNGRFVCEKIDWKAERAPARVRERELEPAE